MDEQRLILNDSLTIDGGEAGQTPISLWLWVPGWTIQRAAAVFTDPKKTEKIEYQCAGSSFVYRGYTQCEILQKDADGRISVCMVKG